MINKIVQIVFCFVLSFEALGQRSLYIAINQNIKSQEVTLGSNFNVGISFRLTEGSVSPFITYEYNFDVHRYFSPNFDRHLIGIGTKYRFFADNRKYSPTLQLAGLMGFNSPYRYHAIQFYRRSDIRNDNFTVVPVEQVWNQNGTFKSKEIISTKYPTAYYMGTLFVGRIWVGNEFKLAKNFYIDFGIGFEFTLWKIGYTKWTMTNEMLANDNPNAHYFYLLPLTNKPPNSVKGWTMSFMGCLGFNYTFPFHKKTKNE